MCCVPLGGQKIKSNFLRVTDFFLLNFYEKYLDVKIVWMDGLVNCYYNYILFFFNI